MKVKINDKTVELKYSFKTEMLFEKAVDYTFIPSIGSNSTYDWYVYFYCTIATCAGDGEISMEQYEKWIEEHPEKLHDFMAWYTEKQMNIQSLREKKIEDVILEKVPEVVPEKKKGRK